MSRARIAPVLTDFMREDAASTFREFPGANEAMRAELRALLAVARAAIRERDSVLEVARYGRNTHQDELDGNWIGRMLEDSDERLACALLRLSRAGRKGGAR